MRRAARVIAFFAVLAVLVAGLYGGHCARAALRWLCGEFWDGFSPRRRSLPGRIADRARSLPSRWRRAEGRHTHREIPPHPRPYIPGLGHLDVPLTAPVPWPDSMPRRAEMTVIDDPAPRGRPYVKHLGEGRWVA